MKRNLKREGNEEKVSQFHFC